MTLASLREVRRPNIVPVHQLSIDARGAAYFTMRLVQGRSLHDWVHPASSGAKSRRFKGLELEVSRSGIPRP